MASMVAQRAASFSWRRGSGVGDGDCCVEVGLGVGGEILEGRGIVGLALLAPGAGAEVEAEEEAAVEVGAADVPGAGRLRGCRP